MKFFCLVLSSWGSDVASDTPSLASAIRNTKVSGNSIQKQVNVIDSTLLTPVTRSDTRLLKGLHQASLVLDGKSDLNSLVAKNRAFAKFLDSQITNATYPGIAAKLANVKADLVAQQLTLRTRLEGDIVDFWNSRIRDGILANFSSTLRNQTTNSIRNVSLPIREMEMFLTVPQNGTDPGEEGRFLTQKIPQVSAKLQTLQNQINFVDRRIRRLVDVREPDALGQIAARIANTTKVGRRNVTAEIAESEESAERGLFKNLNATATFLNADLNETKAKLLRFLISDTGSYDNDISDMNRTIGENRNQTAQLKMLRESIESRLQMVRDGKQRTLAAIDPLVVGLGNSSNAQLVAARTAVTDLQRRVNGTGDILEEQVDIAKSSARKKFSSTVDSLFGAISNKTELAVNDLIVGADAKLNTLNVTLDKAASESSPAALRNATEESINATFATIATTSDLIQAQHALVATKIEKSFTQYWKDVLARVEKLKNDSSASNDAYATLAQSALDAVNAQLTELNATLGQSVKELPNDRTGRMEIFTKSIAPYPDVEREYNGTLLGALRTLTALEANLTKSQSQLSELKQDQTSRIAKLFTILHADDEFKTSLDEGFAGSFSIAKSNASDQLATTKQAKLASFTSPDEMVKVVRAGWSALRAQLESPLPTASLDGLKQEADAVVSEVRRRKFALESLRDELSSEFARNVSVDALKAQAVVDTRLAELRTNWTQELANQFPATGVGKLDRLLADVTPDIVFSETNTLFKRGLSAGEANVGSIDAALAGMTESIQTRVKEAQSSSSKQLTILETAIRSLIDSSTQLVTSDRVLRFRGEVDLAAAVEGGKSGIMQKLKQEFSRTESALEEYLKFLNSTESTLLGNADSASADVHAAALQLGDVKGRVKSLYGDAQLGATELRAKNIAIHRQLLSQAEQMRLRVDEEIAKSATLESWMRSEPDRIGASLIHNVSSLEKWVGSQLSSLHGDAEIGNRTIRSIAHTQTLRMQQRVSKIESEISKVLAALNATELFQIVNQIDRVNGSLVDVANSAHALLARFLGGQGNAVEEVERASKVRYGKIFSSVSQTVGSMSMRIPELLGAEASAREGVLREQADRIETELAGRKFGGFELEENLGQLETENLGKLHQALQESKSSINQAVKSRSKGRQFEEDIAGLRGKIEKIMVNSKSFANTEKQVIENWVARHQSSV